ncbi:MAG: TIGR02217 family protein [Albidovulum sp.]
MAFHEVRFPANLSFGSVGGPERRTEVVALTNGFEERNTPWAESRRRYDAGLGLRSLDDIAELIAFFEARQGQLFGFRWKDWSDFKSCKPSASPSYDDQLIATGDGVTVAHQLVKTYASGGAAQVRVIRKPVAGTVRIGLQGDELQEGVHYVVDTATGIVTFATAPALGERITAGFEFDVPVRFDTDRIQVSVASFQAGDVPQVPVVEVRLP